MKPLIYILCLFFVVLSCKNTEEKVVKPKQIVPQKNYKFGYDVDKYNVTLDTIKFGESFGEIMDRHHVTYPKINKIAGSIKDIFDVRKVRAGKPYVILSSKDSLEKAKVFIYKNTKIKATVIDFKDSIVKAYNYLQPIKTIEKVAQGKIYSNLSNTMDSLGLGANLTYEVADIYAWTLDFYKLQKGDAFKLVYEEKYINDTIFAGYGNIKSAVFNHKEKDLYAFRYLADSINNISEYYDEAGNMLRSQFLKSPIKFRYRISSKYNLKRRIAHYNYRVKPHRGTDFAAANGTPIIATASGTVTESRRRGGNGNYVAVKHNSIYTTKYLHMSKRKAKVGDYVKQGDVIGYVGSTGSSSGNHVCYRFWKNGKEVDPLNPNLKLPEAEPLPESKKADYFNYITLLKQQLERNVNVAPSTANFTTK